ncbi:hypothetical protein [Ruminiclostridium cellulolyticum]|uniref:Lipoprotein n=1 Tax=Ruminiclostridium cellulolyticum (strain ATCC 35319 / DSM 5812 / JCM 6584 / H10) TaxID=394503 RepID=B8I4T5_RUMCH|nr:hypothetical protein [Ruminiclostridium cellulolyticum]ACL76589.1 conserved hypothetical protein [Ruminiclostridium cellulolyticum H10]
MGRKLKILFTIFLLIAASLFSGCSTVNFSIEDTIKPPESKSIALKGTWKIQNYILTDKNSVTPEKKEKYELFIGMEAIFDNEVSAIYKDVCINPQYKSIRTSAGTFIQNKYRISEDVLGITTENVNVVTITTDNQLFHELIVTDANTAFVYMEDGFLALKRISVDIDEKIRAESLGNVGLDIDSGDFKEDPLLRSGVLLGIRSADNSYRTLWLYFKNRETKAKLNTSQLIVPRAKGFWEIGVINNDDSVDIYAEPFAELSQKEQSKIISKMNLVNKKSDAKILFVGNDYIGIESDMRLGVLPIDNLATKKPVHLSDIIEGDSANTLKQSAEFFISSLDSTKASKLNQRPEEDNFTLRRRNGHWIMKSRLYYKNTLGDKKYEDFDVKQMVPSKLIHYDEMNIPWNEIKSRLPWTRDAYMSPNKDILILASGENIIVYTVQNKNTINKQLLKIPILKGESIIMTEWATGKYADLWSEFADTAFDNSYDNGEF